MIFASLLTINQLRDVTIYAHMQMPDVCVIGLFLQGGIHIETGMVFAAGAMCADVDWPAAASPVC